MSSWEVVNGLYPSRNFVRSQLLRALVAISSTVAMVLLVACGGGDKDKADAAPRTFAGRVEGSNAFIAVITSENGDAIAYVCDGDQISQWFRGSTQDGSLQVSDGATSLTAKLSDGKASGTVRLADGRTLRFNAAPANGDAGLWRAETSVGEERAVAGWVILPSGEQRGGIGNVAITPIPIPRLPRLAPAPTLDPRNPNLTANLNGVSLSLAASKLSSAATGASASR